MCSGGVEKMKVQRTSSVKTKYYKLHGNYQPNPLTPIWLRVCDLWISDPPKILLRFYDCKVYFIYWWQTPTPPPTPSVLDIIVSRCPLCIHRIEVRSFTNYIKAKTLKSKEILTCMFMYALIEFKVKKSCMLYFFFRKKFEWI